MKFAKEKKTYEVKYKADLINRIKKLEEKLFENPCEENHELLESHKAELDSIEEKQIHGQIIR